MIRVQGLDPDPAKVVNPGDNVKGFARVLAVLVRPDEIPANNIITSYASFRFRLWLRVAKVKNIQKSMTCIILFVLLVW